MPRSRYWLGKRCQEGCKIARKSCQEAHISQGKAAKKPLLVKEKLPRSIYRSGKLPGKLPRCLKSCQEAPIGWGKAAKKAAKMPGKAAKKAAKMP